MTEQDFKQQHGDKTLFFVAELVEIFRVSRSKIYDMIDEGRLQVLCNEAGEPDLPKRVYRASVLEYLLPKEDI